MDLRTDREQLFARLAGPETVAGFFERVAPDVTWTVEGTHPLAGRHTSKAALTAATTGRLRPLLRGGPWLELQHLVVDGATAVAELRGSYLALDGGDYPNAMCWVCRFATAEPGAPVVEVREYVDSAALTALVANNERPVTTTPGSAS